MLRALAPFALGASLLGLGTRAHSSPSLSTPAHREILGAWYYRVGKEGVKVVFKRDGTYAWSYGKGPADKLPPMGRGTFTFDGKHLSERPVWPPERKPHMHGPNEFPEWTAVVTFKRGDALVLDPHRPRGSHNPLIWRRKPWQPKS